MTQPNVSLTRFEPSSACLIIVDVQERLVGAMPEPRLRDLFRSASILLEAARLWGLPVLITEQYPKGLGPTADEIEQILGHLPCQRFEKLTFSAIGAPGFNEKLAELGRKTCIVIGMEAHVCVFQTVRDLSVRGYSVLVPTDGVTSRRDDHREVGLRLSEAAGACLVTTETLVFDGLEKAGGEAFKALSSKIR